MFKELHAVVAVDDHNGVVGHAAGREVVQYLAHFVVEFRDAAVVQVQYLVQIKLLAGLSLALDDVKWVGEPCHGEARFTCIVGGGKPCVVGVAGAERRMGGGEKRVEEKRFVGLSQRVQRRPSPLTKQVRGGDAAQKVQLG